MNTRRRSMGVVLLVSALVVCLLVRARAYTEDLSKRGVQTLRVATRNAKAMQLAHERYRFEQWFESKFGCSPIYSTVDMECDLLFPLGRADRAYVLMLPSFYEYTWGKYRVYCFQRVDGAGKAVGYKKVYYTDLESIDRPPPKGWRPRQARLSSILDYLTYVNFGEEDGKEHIFSYAITEGVSRYARMDLALRRDCVMYSTDRGGGDLLKVSVMSDYTTEDFTDAVYDIDSDPFTGSLSSGLFSRYGLPVARGELALLR